MPEWNSFLLFVAAGLLLNITPGPDVIYIVGRSIGQGRLAGVVSALGIAAGCLVHIAAAALGLSAVMLAVPLAFDAVRYAGAAYLVWLGLRALLSRHAGLTDAARGPLPLQFVLLGLVFVGNGLIVCLGYALAASWLGDWLKSRYGFSTWLNRVMGGLFIALGLRLAFEKR